MQNLLAAARYASAYTTSNEKGSVLLLPHGVPDILRYTRQENMSYEISGPALQSTIKQNLTMQIEDAYKASVCCFVFGKIILFVFLGLN